MGKVPYNDNEFYKSMAEGHFSFIDDDLWNLGLPNTLEAFDKYDFKNYLKNYENLLKDKNCVLFETQEKGLTEEEFSKIKSALKNLIADKKNNPAKDTKKRLNLMTQLMLNPYQAYTYNDYQTNYEDASENHGFSTLKNPKLNENEFLTLKKKFLMYFKKYETFIPSENKQDELTRLFPNINSPLARDSNDF